MKENARDLIYLDTKRYSSLADLKALYWKIFFLPLILVIFGIVSIKTNGVNWKSLFPLVSAAVWNLLYWIFVLTIQNKRTKKTFELRFLVNGISSLLLSYLFWCLYTSYILVEDSPIVGLDFPLWILLFYLIFSFFYICLIVIGVHKGVYKKIREKSKTPKVLALDALLASIIPLACTAGMYTSKLLSAYASVSKQEIVANISLVLIIFLPALSHINFVQYFYCKKYGILCDEYGDTTSPKLERQYKKKNAK